MIVGIRATGSIRAASNRAAKCESASTVDDSNSLKTHTLHPRLVTSLNCHDTCWCSMVCLLFKIGSNLQPDSLLSLWLTRAHLYPSTFLLLPLPLSRSACSICISVPFRLSVFFHLPFCLLKVFLSKFHSSQQLTWFSVS